MLSERLSAFVAQRNAPLLVGMFSKRLAAGSARLAAAATDGAAWRLLHHLGRLARGHGCGLLLLSSDLLGVAAVLVKRIIDRPLARTRALAVRRRDVVGIGVPLVVVVHH